MSECRFTEPGNHERIKIGAVADHFHVSVDLLRLYEREGLLLPIKSPKGTRYFTIEDYEWIGTLLRLVRDEGLNFAGIRYLLALLPCWDLHRCSSERQATCPGRNATQPCWTGPTCCKQNADCYSCAVYRTAPRCQNLRAMLIPPTLVATQIGAAD